MTSTEYIERRLSRAFNRVGGRPENQISADILHFTGGVFPQYMMDD